MTALLQIDQTGRPAGVAGRARTDGLSTGALVTLTNTGTGSTTRMVLHDVPLGDTTAVATLAPTGNPRVWTFSPTAGVFGTYLIELIEDEGLPTEKRERRVFGVRLQPSGLLIPALNERADEAASIINNGPGYIEESQDNANDYSVALLNQRRYSGWWRKFYELFRFVNDSAPGGSAPTELYVNGTTGNDANTGTVGSPIATLTEAWRRIGVQIRASCNVRIVAAGTYDASAFATKRDFGEFIVNFIADQATEIVVDTGTVDSSTYQQVTASGESWTIDAFAGLTFRVLSGAQAGQTRTIIANTSTAALLLDGFSSNLAGGVTFEVTRPGVVLSFPANGVLQGDSRGYLGLENVELSWPDNSALYFFGSTYLIGVTAQPGASRSSKFVYGYCGAPYCDPARGFGWRVNGSVPAGDIFATVSAEFTLAGRLGYVSLNNCCGVGHSGGVTILGRLALDSTSSDLVIGIQGFGGNYPEVLFDDIGGSVVNGPAWMLGGRAEVVGPMRLEGDGANQDRYAMRDQAFLELTRAAAAGFVDIALGSELRIASGNDGGFDAVLVDGVDALTTTPVAVTFGAAGDSYIGEWGSVARRD